MSQESASYGIGGAAEGAKAGYGVGSVWGAVAGGIIGGVAGYIGGNQAARARKMYNRGMKMQRTLSLTQAAVARRDLIRQARIERASAVAASAAQEGGLQSSAPAGAISSYGSQFGFNLGYFDRTIQRYLMMQKYIDKAGKYARRSGDTMNYLNMAIGIVNAAGSVQGATGSQMGGGMPSGGASSMGGTGFESFAGTYSVG